MDHAPGRPERPNDGTGRIGEGTLPAEQATALVDRALNWQADVSKPWSPGWGVVVESARAADRLPYPKWERYMAQSVTFTLEAFKPGNGIDFATAEMLLARQKEAFERELATAKKIYRLYPRLVDESSRSQHVDANAERSGA